MRRLTITSKSNLRQIHQQRPERRGAVAMIFVVAVTIIGTVLLAQGVRSVLNERRAMPAVFEQQQAQHLLKAGLQQLKSLPSMDDVRPGDWKFARGTLHPEQTGVLQISVVAGTVKISARYPLESDTPITVSDILTKEDWAIPSVLE